MADITKPLFFSLFTRKRVERVSIKLYILVIYESVLDITGKIPKPELDGRGFSSRCRKTAERFFSDVVNNIEAILNFDLHYRQEIVKKKIKFDGVTFRPACGPLLSTGYR